MTRLLTEDPLPGADIPAAGHPRRVRVIHFCPWAERLQDGAAFVSSLPTLDMRTRVGDPNDAALVQMARLDCDWHGENVRAFGSMRRDGIDFLPILTVGTHAALEVVTASPEPGVERWFVIGGQHPQLLGETAGRLFAAYARAGVRILYYGFDEASRTMPCFPAIAPHLSVLIHDESPLAPAPLRPGCLTILRSWVANLVPFSAPFEEEPSAGILFVGSKVGLTPHRRRQLEFLRERFKDRFTAICDHSLPVAGRLRLGRYKVGFCPEGRKFGTPAMAATHTDRPFWSGCLGMVPVSEDSQEGGRLESLHRAGLINRYPHADLGALAEACEHGLAESAAARRRIYTHFNTRETIGAVVSDAISRTPPA